MNTLEPYYIAYEDGIMTTIFHVDDRLTREEQIMEFKRYELPFSCMRINVYYFNTEDVNLHKLTVKVYYNLQGYNINAVPFERDNLHLYNEAIRATNGFFAIDALDRCNNTITFFEVIDPEWQPISARDMRLLTVEEFAMYLS